MRIKETESTVQEDVLKRIESNMLHFSKGQRLIGKYILDHYDKIDDMTAARLSSLTGVSESTVVRFCVALGYTGYPDFLRALRELNKIKLTKRQRFDLMSQHGGNKSTFDRVLSEDIRNIEDSLKRITKEEIAQFTTSLLEAERVYIIGLRTSTILSEYLGFYLSILLDQVIIVKDGMQDVFEQILKVGEGDVVLGIAFPRYSQKTFDLLEYAKKKNATLAVITDSKRSPIYGISDHSILCKSNMASFVDSLVAPLSVINALILETGFRRKDIAKDYFDRLEDFWEKNHTYRDKW